MASPDDMSSGAGEVGNQPCRLRIVENQDVAGTHERIELGGVFREDVFVDGTLHVTEWSGISRES